MCLLLSACGKEPSQPTEVLVTVHSNFAEELTRVEVRLFDVREERSSDGYDFDLSSALTLPISFAVVPGDGHAAQRLLVVVTGKNARGEVIAQNKAIAAFTSNEFKALDVWLLQACRSVMCAAGQTCGAANSVAGQCSETPTVVTRVVRPGEENKETIPTPVLRSAEGDDGGRDGGLDATDGGEGGSDVGGRDSGASSPFDAGRDAGSIDTNPARDASVDATTDASVDATIAKPDAAIVVPDAGPTFPADPVLPLGSCQSGSTTGCNAYEAALVTIQLGAAGAIMEPNVGAGYANTLNAGDTLAGCSTVLQSYGYIKLDADFLADPGTVDLRLYTLYRPANWTRAAPYPIVLWSNVACLLPEEYGGLLRFVASQGFIVIAANARLPSGGVEALNALRFALALNNDANSPYYRRMDTTRIAAAGDAASSARAAADARINTAVMMHGTASLNKPFLMIGADIEVDLGLSTLMTTLSQADAGAYIFLHGNDYNGKLISVREPNRIAAPLSAWLGYRLRNDASDRSQFIGARCGLCNRPSEFDYAQKGLN
jgi:hypothetical protein